MNFAQEGLEVYRSTAQPLLLEIKQFSCKCSTLGEIKQGNIIHSRNVCLRPWDRAIKSRQDPALFSLFDTLGDFLINKTIKL